MLFLTQFNLNITFSSKLQAGAELENILFRGVLELGMLTIAVPLEEIINDSHILN